MALSITQHSRFKNDCLKYQTKIDSISDLKKRNHATQLLSQLIEEVSRIDNFHENIMGGLSNLDKVDQRRSLIISLRKELEQLLTSN